MSEMLQCKVSYNQLTKGLGRKTSSYIMTDSEEEDSYLDVCDRCEEVFFLCDWCKECHECCKKFYICAFNMHKDNFIHVLNEITERHR
jgi:hypothetical protein